METFNPTEEQVAAVQAALTGKPLAIEAGAGTGKTSTLKLIAEAMPEKSGAYVAFNKAIATEAASKFPASVNCSTIHSLAMRAVGADYRHRLNGPWMRPEQVAARLQAQPIGLVDQAGESFELSAERIAILAMATVEKFCQTADRTPQARHVPRVEHIEKEGEWALNREVAAHVAPLAVRAWEDLSSPSGTLRFSHSHYLKVWELGEPVIHADYLLVDEAQDLNPLMLSVVEFNVERGMQVIFVGDTAQQIYSWNGAVNAMNRAREMGGETVYLTKSFRFGSAVAEIANRVLTELDSPMRIEGAGPDSVIEPVDEPDAVLCRSNAAVIDSAIYWLAEGKLVGVPKQTRVEVERFAKAAAALQAGKTTTHEALAMFSRWSQVVDWLHTDPTGSSDVAVLVRLVEQFGTSGLLDVMNRCVDAESDNCEVVVTTGHKSKGCEWGSVVLGSGFAQIEDSPGDEELRLLYVAATRAERVLDVTEYEWLTDDDTTDDDTDDEAEFTEHAEPCPVCGERAEPATWHDSEDHDWVCADCAPNTEAEPEPVPEVDDVIAALIARFG